MHGQPVDDNCLTQQQRQLSMCVRALVCFLLIKLCCQQLLLLLHPKQQQDHSVEGLQFLEGLGLNLSTIVRLGGHSFPRTHSNPVGACVHTCVVRH